MCEEIRIYKEQHNNDFSNYFNLKDIERDAESLNQQIGNKIAGKNGTISAIDVAKYMGFKLYLTNFEDRKISGQIGISEKLIRKYNHDKVIILNNQDTDEHILFTIIHELAHYIYDYNPIKHTDGYFDKYKTDEAMIDREIRANRFAAAFLMPTNQFIKLFEENKDNQLTFNENIRRIAQFFRVPITSVKLRVFELGLPLYE